MKIRRFNVKKEEEERLERFLALHQRLYEKDYYYYSETDLHRQLIGYYGQRADYAFELLLAEQADGEDVGRLLVGRCESFPWAFFGFFECPDDPACFAALMGNAADIARGLGASELRGPVDLNAIHGWMFLLASDGSGRWVGDPYHPAYYPRLFEDAGWQRADESVSGIVREEENELLLAKRPSVAAYLEEEGFQLVRRGDIPDEEFLRRLWDVVKESFTREEHRFVPIEYEVFRQLQLPLLERLEDPYSLIAYVKDEALAGFALSYRNFIERLCNPDGMKPKPSGQDSTKSYFAMKSVAVAPAFWGKHVYLGLITTMAEHMKRTYGHTGAWRRTNVANPGTRLAQEMSEITHRYATFLLKIAG